MSITKEINWKSVKGVCLDIDETLSTHGKLTAEAYSALWDLKNAGYWVVPLTGRPAGWCDHFARFWPVDAVVGENGAFTFQMQAGKGCAKRQRIATPFEMSATAAQKKLKTLHAQIQKKFKDVAYASDQAYREFDLAVDICEDVKAWPRQKIEELLLFCEQKGAHTKLSSIHVNIWYGSYDKLAGFKHWLKKTSKAPAFDNWIFIGDSPNDEPLFKGFKQSVGVANVRQYLSRLKSKPTWITSKESGAGFAEFSRKLV